MREQVQTHNKTPAPPMPAPPVSVFQSRPFSAQNELDESPSLEHDASTLFGTYLQRRATTSQIIQPKLGDGAEREWGTVSQGIEGAGLHRENNTGLPDHLKAGIETLSGIAMDDVRVHYNSPKPAQLQALAYTQGTNIHVGPKQERHLPHEGWHVVQQKQGRVKPTMQAKGVAINDDLALEQEADVMGAKALQMMRRDQVATRSTLQMSTSLQRNERAASPLPVPVQRERKGRSKHEDKNTLVVKVSIGGSGYSKWATHENDKKWELQDQNKNTSKPTYYRRNKKNKVDLSFAGPGGQGTKGYGFFGLNDRGSNSIKKLAEYIPSIVKHIILTEGNKNKKNKKNILENKNVIIFIKGHSRGAVAASQAAKKLESLKYKVELVLFDPVPGPGHQGQDTEIELGNLKGSTVVYSVASGHNLGFSPQTVYGANRIIISEQDHRAGLTPGFKYKNKIYKGSNLNSLWPGVYFNFPTKTNEIFESENKSESIEKINAIFKIIKAREMSEYKKKESNTIYNYFTTGLINLGKLTSNTLRGGYVEAKMSLEGRKEKIIEIVKKYYASKKKKKKNKKNN